MTQHPHANNVQSQLIFSLEVSGAGTPEVNGVYMKILGAPGNVAGFLPSTCDMSKLLGNGTIVIHKSFDNFWYISSRCGSNDLTFYGAPPERGSHEDKPPANAWLLGTRGILPNPSLRVGMSL